jgi:hypothetical protein
MISFFSSCSSCLSCCPYFYNQNSGTFNANINPRRLSFKNVQVSCQLVTFSKYNPNEKKFTELAPDDLRLATDVGQFFRKSEDKINDQKEILNSAEQPIPNNPHAIQSALQ